MDDFEKEMTAWIHNEVERAYGEWERGNYYKHAGAYYEVGTGEYVCPCE